MPNPTQPPEIGLYGNHVFRFFGSDAFGRPNDASFFFNFEFANLALPEIYRYLLHIEQTRRLPKKLILVQITSPNIDNGEFIINFGYELPPDLLKVDTTGDGPLENAFDFGVFAWQVIENWLHETFNYSTFVLSFVQDENKKRVINPGICQSLNSTELASYLFRHAPSTLQDQLSRLGIDMNYCRPGHWWPAFRRDGSNDAKYSTKALIMNEEPLNNSTRALHAGDEYEIARQMRAINAIGDRNNTKVVFVVPPAFEANRDGSIVNQIFNRALAMVPDLIVIDDRNMRNDRSLFVDYLHPSPIYFQLLASELRRRGFISN